MSFWATPEYFGWTFLTFLVLTLDLVGRVTCSATSLGWLIRGFSDCGLELHRPKWKASKNIIKANVAPWQLNINFKLYSFLQTPSPWGRGWDILAFEYQLYFISICLLMKQCSRVGIPAVEQPFTYKVMTFDAAVAQLTLTLFPIP